MFGTSGCCSTNPFRFRLRRLRLLYLPPSPATNLCAPQVRSLVQKMMSEYPRTGSYRGSMYEHGIDAKIVIMGNTGQFPLRFCLGHSTSPAFLHLFSSGVGKTSLLQRYTQDKFDPKNTTSTTGAFFVTKKVYKDGLKVRLQLWDTAGQERFRSMVCWHLALTGNPADHILIALPCNPPLHPNFDVLRKGTHVLSRRKCRTAPVRYYECCDV
jgi:hypothetical protein